MEKFAQRGVAPIAVLLPLLLVVGIFGLVFAINSRASTDSFATSSAVCQSACSHSSSPTQCLRYCNNLPLVGNPGWQSAPSQSTTNQSPVGSGTTAAQCQNICSNKNLCLSACASKGGTSTQCQQLCSNPNSCVPVCKSMMGEQSGQGSGGGGQGGSVPAGCPSGYYRQACYRADTGFCEEIFPCISNGFTCSTWLAPEYKNGSCPSTSCNADQKRLYCHYIGGQSKSCNNKDFCADLSKSCSDYGNGSDPYFDGSCNGQSEPGGQSPCEQAGWSCKSYCPPGHKPSASCDGSPTGNKQCCDQ